MLSFARLIVAGALLATRSLTSGAPDVTPPGTSADPRCELRHFPGGPLGYEPYPYHTADVRAGADCVFSVDPDLAVSVHLVGDPDNEFRSIEVFRLGGPLLQRIELPFCMPPPRDAVYFHAEDIDFDGHRDFGLLVDYRPPGNAVYRYWLFDRDTGRFVDHPDTARLTNPSVDAAAKALVTYSNGGGNGMLYRRAWQRFAGGHLGLVREETQTWVDGHYEHTLKEPRDGVLSVVSTTIVLEQHTGPYDTAQWEVVKGVTAGFGTDPGRAKVLLLRSREVTGESGVGGELHDVNVVIARGDRVLYRFKSSPPRFGDDTSSRFLVSERLDVRDVTGDGIPEVLFGAGYTGASSWGEDIHVVHYAPARRRFEEVRHPDFGDGALGEFRWADVDGRPVALEAGADWADGETHYEPHYYEYRAYCWDRGRGAFTRIWSARSEDRHQDQHALDEEISRILPGVRAAARDGCAPQGRSSPH